jgi:hypothetical protein
MILNPLLLRMEYNTMLLVKTQDLVLFAFAEMQELTPEATLACFVLTILKMF